MTEVNIQETLHEAIELAVRAPSIHNSQPWRFHLSDGRVDLYADLDRWLPATDADGRDLLLSCGAALHHLRIALANAGVHATVHRIPPTDEPTHLATVLVDAEGPAEGHLQLFSAIATRRTDRRPFTHWPLPDAFQRELGERAAEQGAQLRVVDDTWSIDVLTKAIGQAATAHDQVAGYQSELASWTGRDGDDGIPRGNLIHSAPADFQATRRFAEGDIKVGPDDGPDGATLMVLGTSSDDRLSQLRAGEALSAVLLQATQLGLASCPLSQPLEMGTTREILRDRVLGGTLSPQLVFRFGWAPAGSPLPATPRRAAVDVINLVAP